MKHFFYKGIVLTLVILNAVNVTGQNLTRVTIGKKDLADGVIGKYEFNPRESHTFILLLLYKNGKYHYEEHCLVEHLFNNGNWKLSKGKLILNDNLDKDDLPVKITCSGKIDTVGALRIQELKNLKGDWLTDCLVYVNNDSNSCLPLGFCLQEYKNIDSVKVGFPNKYKSKWIPVLCKANEQIELILQSEELMSSYMALRCKEYQVFKSYLKPVNSE